MLQPFSCLFPHPVLDRDEVAQEFADIGKNLPGSEDLAELAVRITFGVVQPVEEFGIGFQKSLVSVAVEALLEELESQPVAREAPGRQAFLLFGQKLRHDLGDGGFCEFRVAGRLIFVLPLPAGDASVFLRPHAPDSTATGDDYSRRGGSADSIGKTRYAVSQSAPAYDFFEVPGWTPGPSSRPSTSATNPALGTNSRMRERISSRRPSRSATCIVCE
jgi:hypothetical protein